MNMDLTNIRTFLRVVEVGNFAKAAEELKYAQSTVTAQIQALEREIGNPLFERIGRKNYLTNAGLEFIQYATDIQNTMKKVSSIGCQADDISFTLRIGVLESLLFNDLLAGVSKFKQRYKKSHIYIKEGQASELLDMLRQNDLDVVYISDNLNTDPSLECLYTKKEYMVFIANKEHPLAYRKNIPITETLDYPYVVTESTGKCYNTLLNIIAEAGSSLQYSVMVNDIGAITVLLRDRCSLSFLPKSILSGSLDTGDLAVLDVDIPSQIYYTQVLVRKSMWMSPAMEHFVSIIKNLNISG